MAESTLTLDYDAIKVALGMKAGWGSTYAAWSSDSNKVAQVDSWIQGGYRQFINHPVIEQVPRHTWTFLRPTTTITVFSDIAVNASNTVSTSGSSTTLTAGGGSVFYSSMVGKSIVITGFGTRTIVSYTSASTVTLSAVINVSSPATWSIAANGDYRLSDDFGSMEGSITFEAGDCAGYTIPLTGENAIRTRRQESTATGRPQCAAIRPDTFDPTIGQRWVLMLWPEPSQNYTLSYRYNVLVGALSTTNKYPLGGMMHSELVLQSCLAYAERKLFDTENTEMQRFMEMLRTSVLSDSRLEPEFMGYNGNGVPRMAGGQYGYGGRRGVYPDFLVTYS